MSMLCDTRVAKTKHAKVTLSNLAKERQQHGGQNDESEGGDEDDSSGTVMR